MWYARVLVLGPLAAGAAVVLSGCGSSPPSDQSQATPRAANSRQSPKAAKAKD